MSCPCDFPNSISLSCGLELARMIAAGTLAENKADALRHAGCLIGSVGNYFENDGPGPLFAMGAEIPEVYSAEGAADWLQANVPPGATTEDPKGALNPILLWVLGKLAEWVLGRLIR